MSCSKNNIDTNSYENINIYTTNELSEKTRSVLENNNVLWQCTDQIGVYATNTYNEKFVNTNQESSLEAYFSGKVSMGDIIGTAYFPYDQRSKYVDGQLHIYLPQIQNFVSNSTFHSTANPSAAYGDLRGRLVFKNLCGVIKVQLKGNVSPKSITFKPNNGLVYGYGVVDFGDRENPVLNMELSENEQYITLDNISGTLSPTQSQNYYIVVPAGTYNGFKLTIKDSNNKTYDKSTTKTLNINRSVITSIQEFEITDIPIPPKTPDTVWLKGLNPPQENWVKTEYGDYMTPYENCGWYDVDKQYRTGLPTNIIDGMFYGTDDYYLCWAAAAANQIHYQLDYYHDLFVQIPQYKPKKAWRHWLVKDLGGDSNGHISEVMEEIKQYYPDKGGMTHIGVLDFYTGFSRMPKGAMGDGLFTEKDLDSLEHRDYEPSIRVLSEQIKYIVNNGGTFSFSVQMPSGGHALTGWGGVFDKNGLLKTIFVTNSDSEQGMHKMGLVEKNGKAYFVINTFGTTWKINTLMTFKSFEYLLKSKIPKK